MDVKQLPARPSLEHYKKQAKNLVKSRKSGDPEALRRIRQHHLRLGRLSDSEFQRAKFSLWWALYGWGQTPPDATRHPCGGIVELMVAAGATVEPG